ncbi:PGPGW domain-containing protein [Denitromonas halophila]|uniref:Transmembrane protein (PGPGW) n=1 Tax=Denitromonas halophila TaxID=1629404 RepID=A0A557R2C4_9RHOO|nr:PGPGW domain-containing protein [Denitromonas halophila]TVO59303.1 hypothetical protein FHP91_00880 [Denitromonas halophila]
MFERIKESWHSLKKSEPGERFQDRYHHHQSRRDGRPGLSVLLRLAGGTVVALLGLVMLFTPGPGLVFMAAGAALLGSESRIVARALDRLEVLVRAARERFEARRRR